MQNTCAFYALSLIIILLYNKCYLGILNQYWRMLRFLMTIFKDLSNIFTNVFIQP